jgi:polyhydroxyalkanoate synthesis regulator phasin
MQDAWRAYLEMALGLTEAPRKKAQKAVGDLANRGGATAAQLQGLVEDLMSTGMANREALTNIVRYEVDRALGVVGLATADEVSELTARVRDLEAQLRAAQARAVAVESGGGARQAAGAAGGIGG